VENHQPSARNSQLLSRRSQTFACSVHDDVGLRKEKKASRDDHRSREEMLQISNTVRQADGGKAEQNNWIRRLRNRSMKKIAIREYFIDFALVYVPRSRDTCGHTWKLRRLAANCFLHSLYFMRAG
jgi:hypothetical protein